MFQNLFDNIFGISGEIKPGQAAAIIMLTLLIALRGWRVSIKYRRKYNKGYVYKRRTFTNAHSRVGARRDDIDFPSGFGGPAGYDFIRQPREKQDDNSSTDGD